MSSLYDEYYDEEIEEKVDVAKSLKAGDKIVLEDRINDIEFHTDEKATILEFLTDSNPRFLAYWLSLYDYRLKLDCTQ